jgi:predicted SprT family Zn-dependent metalloprotease
MAINPTLAAYGDFQAAYEHLNQDLFQCRLPDVMITLARTRHANGYIRPEGFSPQANGAEHVAEIGLNPETFRDRTPLDVLSTLAHEMAHLDLYLNGRMPTNGYHCKAWGRIMKDIGLHPSHTGQPGGKETGLKVSHYIIPGASFEASATALLNDGWTLQYFAPVVTELEKARKRKQRASKTAYVCSTCNARVWGKLGLQIACTDGHPICFMDPEPEND